MIEPFAVVLARFIDRDGRRVRQLSQATGQMFSEYDAVPHNTISRWLRGESKRPRNWRDIVKLAAVLRLTADEASRLLQSAGHPPLATLQHKAERSEQYLFARWEQPDLLREQRPFQAPPRLVHFINRNHVQQQLRRALRLSPRLCCLQGMGGVGKSSLAVEAAYTLRDEFVDGVLWVQLRQYDVLSALQAIATAFGQDVGGFTDVGSRSSKVRELLADKQALLILDDAVDDAELRPLMPPTGSCAVLITSRRHDLAVADSGIRIEVAPFSPKSKDSLTFFTRVLGPAAGSQQIRVRQELADELGHLPLALDIAAQRIKHESRWSPAALLERLRAEDTRLPLLERGDRTVARTLSLSHGDLSPDLQAAFARLAVFDGVDFSTEAASAILCQPQADMERGLVTLGHLSLLQHRQDQRYALHPLVQDYSAALDAAREVIAPYAEYYIRFVVENGRDLTSLDQEQTHIFRALELARTHGKRAAFVDGTVAFFPYLLARGRFDLARKLLTRAELIARELELHDQLAEVLHYLGRSSLKVGEPERAQKQYEEALALSEQQGNDAMMLKLLVKLGALAQYRGDHPTATRYHREALVIAEQRQDVTQLTRIYTNLGVTAAIEGRNSDAETYYEQARTYALQQDDIDATISVLQAIGRLHAERANFQAANASLREGLALAEHQGNPELACRLRGQLGIIACNLENYTEATQHFQEGLRLAQQSGVPLEIYRQRANLGRVALQRHQFEDANFHYAESLEMARRLNYPVDLVTILNQWGYGLLKQKQYARANDCFTEAQGLIEQHNLRSWEAHVLFGLAQVAAARGDMLTARSQAERSEALFTEMDHPRASEVRSWIGTLTP